MLVSAASPLLLLGTLWQRLHAELQHVPTVLVSPKVPLQKRWKEKQRHFNCKRILCCRSSPLILSLRRRCYLCKPHAVPLVCRFLRPGRVHQLEAGLILLVEIGILAATTKLGRVLVWK